MYEIEFYDVNDNLICRHFYTGRFVRSAKCYAEKVVAAWPVVCYAWVFSKFGGCRMFRCCVGLSLG